jgi:OOP family OmpA-OmpF porin
MSKTSLLFAASLAIGLATMGCKGKLQIGSPADDAPPPPPPPAAKADPAPAPAPKKEKIVPIQLPGPVVFETGSAKLKPESDAVLAVVVIYLEKYPQIETLRIEGHTDTDGNDAANQTLSEQRSFSVAKYLVGKGVDCKRLVSVGAGETRRLVKNEKTAEDKAKNRRVAFVNAKVGGKAFGPADAGLPTGGDPCN